MGLKEYRTKRDFTRSPEPKGGAKKSASGRIFVVHKHAARRLHYDLRLEAGGTLKSWAVPKGPSYDPSEKRLAVQVEDHPIEYADFEGIIEEGQYGAGTVMVWDRGTWEPVGDWKEGLEKGHLKFDLNGKKLTGRWKLIRLKPKTDDDARNWLLIKGTDEEVRGSFEIAKSGDVTSALPLSAKTGRSMEEIRGESQRSVKAKWKSTRERSTTRSTQAAPGIPEKALKAPWPHQFFPQLATLVSDVPEGDGWLHEIKFDGYRLLAFMNNGRVQLKTRRGQDWTEKFKSIAKELSYLPLENAIFDGEVVMQDPDGTTNFQKLQNSLTGNPEGPHLYYVFDLPYYNGHDLTPVPLIERKALLHELTMVNASVIPSIHFSDHHIGGGERIFRAACGHAVEGIISKKVDSSYVQSHSHHWLKVKCIKRQEFVVGGYTEPKGSRSHFGSLLLGFYNADKKLIYCGHVGTGFSSQTIKQVYDRLERLKQDRPPFASPIKDTLGRNVHWTSPRLVVEVEFSSWTDAGILRHPSFIGMREDKKAEEVILEKESAPEEAASDTDTVRTPPEVAGIPVRLTHPDRILYPEERLTKKDLAEYYMQVVRWMLPELVRRPLVLVRCPEGIGESCFFQKHIEEGLPESVKTIAIKEKRGTGLYSFVDDLDGLLSLVQMDVLEIHAWGCRVDNLEYPDRMVFDLDPAPDVPAGKLLEATLFLKEWLLKYKVEPFFKLTGGKGIHVVVPLKSSLPWTEVKNTSGVIAGEMVAEKPDLFVSTVTKKLRVGKILVDYFRNDRGATSIVPYSTRASPGAPVALPISDKELNENLLSRHFTISEVIQRVKRLKTDPWEGMRR
jgi:bifunctional non-homologous end joining protein LigD